VAKDYPIKVKFMGLDLVSPTLAKMGSKVSKFTHDASMKFRKLDRAMSDISGKLTSGIKTGLWAVGAAAATVGGALWKVMGAFSVFENAQAAFTPLMGGADGAIKLIERLKEEARTTPYEFENLAAVAQQLLPMMNKDIDKTAITMRRMGDMAGGNVDKMQRITNGYMKALLKGKLDQETLNIITEAGVPIQKELLEMTGVNRKKFSAAMKSGKIGVKELDEAIVRMTSKGGMFYKGMDLASQTLTGVLSTLHDDVTMAAADIGTELAPAVKDLVTLASSYIPKIREWVKAHKDLIRTNALAFVKQLPVYMEKIYNTAKDILSVVGPIVNKIYEFVSFIGAGNLLRMITYFYGLAVAVKACSGTLTIFNSFVNLTAKGTDKATGSIGKFQAGIGVLQVGLAAYTLGTLLYENLVSPLIEAQDRLDKLMGDVADTHGRDVSKRNKEQLSVDITKVKETKKAFEGAASTKIADVIPGMSFFNDFARKQMNDEQARLRGAYLNASGYEQAKPLQSSVNPMLPNWGGEITPAQVSSPTVTVSESTSETKIVSEVTLIDQTGRARVTRGKNGQGGLNLVHTGAM
jgi:tape measure domain-containing protein